MSEQIISAFIVDDEFQGRDVINLMLKNFFPELKIVGQAAAIPEAVSGIEETKPNMVFLDVQLGNETGFQLLDKLGVKDFELIFTTAHSEFAIRAFRYCALDFLLKPIDPEELKSAVLRAKEKIRMRQSSITEQIQLFTHYMDQSKITAGKIAIPSPEGMIFISAQDIIYCHGSGNYTEFHMVHEPKITSSRTLKLYEEILTDSSFFRVHRSYLINLAHVQSYQRGEGGSVKMSNGHEIEIARSHKSAFLNLFKG